MLHLVLIDSAIKNWFVLVSCKVKRLFFLSIKTNVTVYGQDAYKIEWTKIS